MLFRNRALVRVTACLLLTQTVGSLLAPGLAYASMGPGQPEFTSYEAPGSTDMVNLTTGDFTYNIPVLDVPGPERSFSLPLTYRAGIRLEQEASWVGLGWSLNPGAIARSLNGYPDDAVNDPTTTTYKQDVRAGWSGGMPGVLDLAWDSETGHSGSADLIGLVSVGWANGKVASGDLVGVKYSREGGLSVDPVRMAFAASTIVSLGTAGSALAAAAEASKSLGTNIGMGAVAGAASMALGKSGGSGGGFNRPTVRTEKRWFHTNYWVFFNDNKAEMMYGSLYFGNTMRALKNGSSGETAEERAHPTLKQGNGLALSKPKVYQYTRNYGTAGTETREVGTDLQQYAGKTDNNYATSSLRPISIAHDDFSVMGEGVSGSIRPFRLDVGSLAFPKVMSDDHNKYNVTPFLDDYKVGFRYENSLSSGYDGHDYTPTASNDPVGIEYSTTQSALILQDARLYPHANDAVRRTPGAKAVKGIVNRPNTITGSTLPRERKVVQGKHIKWYSNAEIERFYENSPTGIENGFLEFEEPVAKQVKQRVPAGPICATCPNPSAAPGYALSYSGSGLPGTGITDELTGNGSVDLTRIFKPGDIVHNKATTNHRVLYTIEKTTFPPEKYPQDEVSCDADYEHDDVIKSVTPNSLKFTNSLPIHPDLSNCITPPGNGYSITHDLVILRSISSYVKWPYKDTIYVTNNPFRKLMPRGSIGAFSVTAEDGTTYHYSLPVYNYNQFSRTHELIASGGRGAGESTQMLGERGRDYGYATAWLLTAITSPDYVDRGTVGVVDDADWGGWVKLEYGRFARRYKWRQPYIGGSYPEDDMNTESFSEGSKQTYYLNAIHTRTHTALFVKSVRNDARGHFNPSADSTKSNLAIDETGPSSSLRLDEIVLLKKEDWEKLKTTDGIRLPTDENPAVIPAFGVNTGNNSATHNEELRNRDTYEFVLDQHDVDADTRIRRYLNDHAAKRIVFNYSYALCPGTPNSFPDLAQLPAMDEASMSAGRTGKLTLTSVATFGPLNTKLIPDFVFTYGANPAYGKEKWDGFGMYNSAGQKNLTSHTVSTNNQTATTDGAAWSLTSILNPLGSTTQIQYERDQYAHISEFDTQEANIFSNARSGVMSIQADVPLTSLFAVNDVLDLKGEGTGFYECKRRNGPIEETYDDDDTYEITTRGKVVAVDASTVTLDQFPNMDVREPECKLTSGSFGGKVKISRNTNGGDIRVAAITTAVDNSTSYTVKYKYARNYGVESGTNSSGVIAKVPDFIPHTVYNFYNWFDYPSTSVMYGKVHVLRGAFKTAADYEQREEYSFYTPSSDMVRQEVSNETNSTQSMSNGWQLTRRRNKTTVDVGKIGQPIAIRRFNRSGHQEFASTFTYANDLNNPAGISGQGKFTEGVLTTEKIRPEGTSTSYYRVNRSTKQYLPTVLVGTRTVANGISVESRNTLFDFFTGQVVETTAKNSLGYTYRTRTVPAYTLLPYGDSTRTATMGPKDADETNANMLVQPAAFYTYKQQDNGPASVLSAAVQTWKKDWNTYREYNATTDQYQNVSAQVRRIRNNAEVDVPVSQWRQHENYVWNGTALNPDGSYANFVDFNWQAAPLSTQYSSWLNTGGVTRYDHYSKVLETRDVNGTYNSQKLGHRRRRAVASTSNARYTETVYSGAEDKSDKPDKEQESDQHFGGEVRNAAFQFQSTQYAHTGSYSSKIPAGEAGFTYQAVIGSDVLVSRPYRLSVWLHKDDLPTAAGRLSAKVEGVTLSEVAISHASVKRAGNWYLLNLFFTIPTVVGGASTTGKTLTVGCWNTGTAGYLYADDFRFQPVDGAMTACVYDPKSWQVSHVLDNDNLYTRYEYDAAGKLLKVFKEVLTPGTGSAPAEKQVKEYQYHYGRSLQ